MIIEADGYSFDFTDAINAFVFDEKDKTKPTYHGVTALKAVDIIVELEDKYLFIEMKYYDPATYTIIAEEEQDVVADRQQINFNRLKNWLKLKYRDSYLYRYAENKTDKPIYYLCLLNFDNAQNTLMKKFLSKELPVGRKSPRWTCKLAEDCHVLNVNSWNKRFPNWPVQRV